MKQGETRWDDSTAIVQNWRHQSHVAFFSFLYSRGRMALSMFWAALVLDNVSIILISYLSWSSAVQCGTNGACFSLQVAIDDFSGCAVAAEDLSYLILSK